METYQIIIGIIVVLFFLSITSSSKKRSLTNEQRNILENIVNKEVFKDDESKKNDRNEAIDFAQEILQNKDKYIILDTETTGVGRNDVIVHIGIIDLEENVLLDTLIKPTKRKRMNIEATNIHKITMSMLKDSPSFEDILDNFLNITENKIILMYNRDFDSRLLSQTIHQDEISCDKKINMLDVMIPYSAFVGIWNDYHKDYKWQKLPGASHSSIGDCKSTLKVIHKMANSKKE